MPIDPEDEYEEYFDEEYELTVSKSQKKREMHDLLKLSEKALTLSDEKLQKTGLDEKILQAIREARKMKASGAKNRQLKYITKLVSHADTDILEEYLRETEQAQILENQRFHQLEKWRDRLIEHGDSAIGDFLDEFTHADRQQLRTLVRQAQKEAAEAKPPTASRKLFKYLRLLTN